MRKEYWANGHGLLARMERDLISRTLRDVRGNREAAAKALGIGERTLYRMLKRFRLEPKVPKEKVCSTCKGRRHCPACKGRGVVKIGR